MQLTSEVVGKSYDDLNALFAVAFGGHIHNGYWYSTDDDSTLHVAMQRLNDLVIEKVAARKGWSVLDLGCGTGELARQLAERAGCESVGVSNSQVQMAEANAAARAANLDGLAKFQFADAHSLPFPDARFDAALAVESLCQMEDRPRVFSELGRVLRPGGRLVVVDFAERVPISPGQKDFLTAEQQADFMRFGEIGDLFGRAGFHLLESMDLSWNSPLSQATMLEAIRQRRTELSAHYSAEFIDTFEDNWMKISEIFEKHMAYLLLIAEKAPL